MGNEADRKIRETFHVGEYSSAGLPNLPVRPPNRLTPGERAVIALLYQGKSDPQIARARKTSLRTVLNQLTTIRRKLGGLRTRDELVALLGGPPR